MIVVTKACGNANLEKEMVLWTATLYVDKPIGLLVWMTDYLRLKSWFELKYDTMTRM